MKVLVMGAGAQARLSYPILRAAGHEMPIVYDENRGIEPPWDCEMIHDLDNLLGVTGRCDGFIVCVSGTYRGEDRRRLARIAEGMGLVPVGAVHPTAYVASSARIGRGLQTYPRAIVNEFATVGDYCVLGSNSVVDHDCRIGNSVHVMGSAVLASEVEVRDCAAIGTNSTVIPGIRIGEGSVIGAGSVVTHDVPDHVVAVGVPARVVRSLR